MVIPKPLFFPLEHTLGLLGLDHSPYHILLPWKESQLVTPLASSPPGPVISLANAVSRPQNLMLISEQTSSYSTAPPPVTWDTGLVITILLPSPLP